MEPTGDDRGVMIAVTFAEAGEWETARRYAPAKGTGRAAAWIERHLLASAYAEEGMQEEALRLAGAAPRPTAREEAALDALLRARGIRMFCGVASPAALAARR